MEHKIVHEFSRLRVLPQGKSVVANSDPPSPITTKKLLCSKKMDALVHDLHTALELDEAYNSSANAASGPATAAATNSNRRRVWRRRCKSTSNLSCLNAGSANSLEKKNQSQNSEDSSSSTEDDTRAVILTNDRGTSSLQLSDSEEELKLPSTSRGSATSNAGTAASNLVRRSANLKMDQSHQTLSNINANNKKLMMNDTDSVNENFSPVRPSTKRKRKFKRMALDPDNHAVNMDTEMTTNGHLKNPSASSGKTGTIKRKKVRSKSACDSSSATSKSRSGASGATLKSPSIAGASQRQRQVSTANVVPGKRKRSSREKSVEPDLILHTSQSSIPSHSMISEEPSISNDAMIMDCDDNASRRSSSSLSSSDWEDDQGPDGNSDESRLLSSGLPLREDDGEADDEQSDWPGHESGSVYGNLTDDETDLEMPLFYATSASMNEDFQSLTSTARQAYLARMKRLADCVPGREIRAGSRRLRNPQSGFTIKSSSSEQLSRFLQDPQRTELRLTVLRATDRSKIAQMATLYSLQLRYEGPNILVLAKTGKTVKMDGFIVPKTPAAKNNPPMEVKRRRRTPPPSPSSSNIAANPVASGALTDSPIDEKSPISTELTRRQSN